MKQLHISNSCTYPHVICLPATDKHRIYRDFFDDYIEPSNEEESSEQKWFHVTGNEAKYALFHLVRVQ